MDIPFSPPFTDVFEVGTLLMTADQLATALQISKRSIWRLCDERKIPEPIRLGGAVRWRVKEVEAWLASGCPRRSGN
jgi:excisionase family DNA binding protein